MYLMFYVLEAMKSGVDDDGYLMQIIQQMARQVCSRGHL